MPDTGNPYLLPYPELAEEADAPYWLHQLASAEHIALATVRPRSTRYKSTPQVMPLASTHYLIDFNVDDPYQINSAAIPYGDDGLGNGGIWTIQESGLYLLAASCHLQFTGSNIGLRLSINVSGLRMTWPTVAASVNSNVYVSKLWRLVAGDTVAYNAWCTAANTTCYGTVATHYTWAEVSYVRP